LTIGIIVDASESQKDQFDEHRQTTVSLLEKLFRPGDRAFVLSVDEDIRLWAALTDRVSEVRRQLAGPPGALFGEPCAKRSSAATRPISDCGSSPLWNAVYAAANLELTALRGNKILLLLTDGFDSGSSHGWRQAADAVQRPTRLYLRFNIQVDLAGVTCRTSTGSSAKPAAPGSSRLAAITSRSFRESTPTSGAGMCSGSGPSH
jgi:hypothetical protein